jgi:hypothetical protein
MVQRTEYRHLTTDTIRGGPTGHGESLADMESYLLPLARLQARSHFISGVLEGLRVSASLGQAAVQVSTGSALDGAGNLIALVVDGFAVIDPDVDIEAVENVPTVVVGSEGVSVPTTGASGQSMLVIRWCEVSGTAGTFVRLHAPCVRLVPFDTFDANDRDVPLARVAIGAAGAVEELDVDRRDLAELWAGSVQLWAAKYETNGAIAQQPVAELFGTDGPGVGLTVSGRRALTIDGGTLQATFAGDVVLQGALRRTGGLSVDGDATLSGGLTVNGGPGVHSGGNLASYSFADRSVATFVGDPQAGERWVWYADAATARLWSGADKFWVNKDGNVGLGIAVGEPIHRTVYVGGPNSSGIHIEGSGAGYSFADRRQPPGYVDNPDGQRWVWYAIDGTARLWSGRDLLTVGSPGDGDGLEVWGRMRMREGKGSAGAWFFQNEIPTNGQLPIAPSSGWRAMTRSVCSARSLGGRWS